MQSCPVYLVHHSFLLLTSNLFSSERFWIHCSSIEPKHRHSLFTTDLWSVFVVSSHVSSLSASASRSVVPKLRFGAQTRAHEMINKREGKGKRFFGLLVFSLFIFKVKIKSLTVERQGLKTCVSFFKGPTGWKGSGLLTPLRRGRVVSCLLTVVRLGGDRL